MLETRKAMRSEEHDNNLGSHACAALLHDLPFFLTQAHIEANDWPPHIDSEILIPRLREVGIGYVHVCRSGFNAEPWTEVIARSAAHHESERQVLALGIEDAV